MVFFVEQDSFVIKLVPREVLMKEREERLKVMMAGNVTVVFVIHSVAVAEIVDYCVSFFETVAQISS